MSAIKRYDEDLMGGGGFEEYLNNQMERRNLKWKILKLLNIQSK